MKEIKFRGKRIDVERWAYGYFIKTPITAEFNTSGGSFFDSGGIGRYCIIQNGVAHEIDIKTVGQFTGLHDKNGVEIYEGDIIEFETGKDDDIKHYKEEVTYEEGCYPLIQELQHYDYFLIIGNIYNNPELLK